MPLDPPLTRISWHDTSRLVPSRYPSAGLFDRVASREDLELVMELEAWTNDRVNTELGLIHAVPPEEWVTGRPMASVVMAAFCHPNPRGSRFSSPQRGAWYAARHVDSAIAESLYHRGRELHEIGVTDARMEMRLYRADFRNTFHDLRGGDAALARVLDPDSYLASQALAARLLAAGSNGVVYPCVRDPGGECIACFRPPLVLGVRTAGHYELRWEAGAEPIVRHLG
jgi:RES domain